MDVMDYCSALLQDLTVWKAKIYDVIRIVDQLSSENKETVYPSIQGLHTIVAEIDSELEQLRTACPADWSPNRQNLDAKMAELQQTLKKLSEILLWPITKDNPCFAPTVKS